VARSLRPESLEESITARSEASADRGTLVRYAHEANRREQWLAGHALWSELDRQSPEPYSRIMALETARLAGVLPLIALEPRDSISAIITVLTAPHSENLLADVIRRSEGVNAADLELLKTTYAPLSNVLRSAIAHAALRRPNLLKLIPLNAETVPIAVISAALAVSRSVVISSHRTSLPELDVLFSDITLDQTELDAVFRATEVLELADVLVTSNSDALRVSGTWYFDAVTYAHSEILDVFADPLILAFSKDSVVIDSDRSLPAPVANAIWLGYPLTEAWGHFLLECLTRLAIIHSEGSRSSTVVIVNSKVPKSFLDFANVLYPWAVFAALEPGQSMMVSNCIVVPSRALTPTRFRWSEDGNAHAIMDGESLRQLGLHMQQASEQLEQSADHFATKVYLDRTAGNYRKSNSENQIRELALAHGFVAVDPGTLSPEQELSLFVHATHIAGFYGSQMILTAAMMRPRRQLYIYHDESTEMRAVSTALERSNGNIPQWILGSRPHFVPGYSEQSIQQAILLSDDALEVARLWFKRTI
jgi:hypothetical protein